MTLRIYDTRAGKKVEWTPMVPGKVGIYVCGITVYDICHVGHARMLVAFDVIVRYLRARGLEVRFVRNVTDVDDKIIRRGQRRGALAPRPSPSSTRRRMNDDMRALGIAPADAEPRATEHIAEMIDVVDAPDRARAGLRGRAATSTTPSGASPPTASCPARASTI